MRRHSAKTHKNLTLEENPEEVTLIPSRHNQSNQPYITYNTTKEVTLIPSRHRLPLVQQNNTKNVDLDPLKNTQHFSAIHTKFLSTIYRITLVTEQI